jgi:hypothetical protein
MRWKSLTARDLRLGVEDECDFGDTIAGREGLTAENAENAEGQGKWRVEREDTRGCLTDLVREFPVPRKIHPDAVRVLWTGTTNWNLGPRTWHLGPKNYEL